MGRLSPLREQWNPEQSVTWKSSYLSEIMEHSSPYPYQALEFTPPGAALCTIPSAEALLIQDGLSHCGGLTLGGREVPTKATLSFPLLSWTGEGKYN